MSQIAITGAGQNCATVSLSGTNISNFGPFGSINGNAITTADVPQPNGTAAATLANLSIQVGSNTFDSSNGLTSRKNSAAGAQAVVWTAGTSGVFTDSTHTDSLAAADTYGFKLALNSSGTTKVAHVAGISASLSTASQCFCLLAAFKPTGTGITISTTKQFASLSGQITATTTEGNTQSAAMEGATFSGLNLSILTSGNGTNTYAFRKNAVDGNQAVVSSGGGGSDSTHTDSVVSGDLFNYSAQRVGGSISLVYSTVSVQYQSSTSNVSPINSAGAAVASSAATNNWPLGGHTSKSTTETDTTYPLPVAATLGNLTVRLTINTDVASENWQLRKNGANINSVAAVTANTTGIFTDITHTDSLVVADKINIQTVSTFTTTSTVAAYGALLTTTPPPSGAGLAFPPMPRFSYLTM